MICIWALNLAHHGGRDPLSGLALFFGYSPYHTLNPSFAAQQVHNGPFDYGWENQFPTKISQYRPEQRKCRVEAWPQNRGVQSYRYPTIVAYQSRSTEAAQELLDCLARAGLIPEFKLPTAFEMTPECAEEYMLNGLSPIELRKMFPAAAVPFRPKLKHVVEVARAFNIRLSYSKAEIKAAAIAKGLSVEPWTTWLELLDMLKAKGVFASAYSWKDQDVLMDLIDKHVVCYHVSFNAGKRTSADHLSVTSCCLSSTTRPR